MTEVMGLSPSSHSYLPHLEWSCMRRGWFVRVQQCDPLHHAAVRIHLPSKIRAIGAVTTQKSLPHIVSLGRDASRPANFMCLGWKTIFLLFRIPAPNTILYHLTSCPSFSFRAPVATSTPRVMSCNPKTSEPASS
jgi:hypothetical protein